MISKELQKALNDQVNAELWSAYLYLAMSLDSDAKNQKGFANWFYVQFKEELAHARIFMNYLVSRDAQVQLQPIEAVPTEWESILAMFRDTLTHERKVTAMINNLASISARDNDFATSNMLLWFINEQVEEEETARDLIADLEAVEGNKFGLYMLDKDQAARVYVAPSPLAVPAN